MNSYPNGNVAVFDTLDLAQAAAALVPGTVTMEVTGPRDAIDRVAAHASLGAAETARRKARRRQQAASRRANRRR